ncbi:MAG: PorV/PorQ family protein [Candidatus Delongbacteria bacterium]|nr:PorV/PorQ family protein [Candidatus Delongbacteria bacterium]
MKTIIYWMIVVVLTGVISLQGGVLGDMTKSGTTAAQFLKIPAGTRGIGMGGAGVASVNDVSSVYWNPAGMTRLTSSGAFHFSHANWLADLDYNYAGAVVQLGIYGCLGFSFTSLSVPDMPVRTEFDQEGTGEFFSAMDMAMGLSYARSLTDRFAIGITAKYIRQQIWHMTATTTAIDLGLLFRTDLEWLTLGMAISNFGPKLQYSGKDLFINYDFNPEEWGDNETIFADLQTDQWDLPLVFRFGLNLELVNNPIHQVTASLEARHPNDNSETISCGAEYGFRKRFFLRGGWDSWNESDSEKGLTVGGGCIYYLSSSNPVLIDYAYSDWGRLNYVHRFSVEIRF